LLDEPYRELVKLRDIEGLTFDVVAQRMGKSATVVRGLHREACAKLRELLETAAQFTSGPG
jgi:DNA-directed RNA polymerase specialized sigma24 family protein